MQHWLVGVMRAKLRRQALSWILLYLQVVLGGGGAGLEPRTETNNIRVMAARRAVEAVNLVAMVVSLFSFG